MWHDGPRREGAAKKLPFFEVGLIPSGRKGMGAALHLTVEEYDRMALHGEFDRLDRRIELIRGEIREKCLSTPLHDDLICYLCQWSVLATERATIHISVKRTLDLAAQVSRPEPDLLWIRAGRYRHRYPASADTLLVIEVGCGSLEFDLGEKAQLYAEAQVVEYWIVDAETECVHVYRAPKEGQYTDQTVIHRGQTVSPLACPAAVLNLDDLFSGE
jgi:Uma2 family endonuclease